MATAVCDTKPCDQMQVMLTKFHMHKSTGMGHPQLYISKVAEARGSYASVKMHYCPFCGTRIVQGVLAKVPER
jgi:hypothetical protein